MTAHRKWKTDAIIRRVRPLGKQAYWDLSPIGDRIALCRATHGFRLDGLFE